MGIKKARMSDQSTHPRDARAARREVRRPLLAIALAAALLALAAPPPAASAAEDDGASAVTPSAVFVVTNTNDGGAGSLRQAVLDANAAATSDTITFDPNVFGTPQTITLASQININPTNGDTLTITGPGANLLTLSGNNVTRMFENGASAAGDTTSMSGMTLTLGRGSGNGGAINNRGILTVADMAFTQNTATGEGGAIYSAGGANSLTVVNCTFANNAALGTNITGDGGGAISSDSPGSSITDSFITGSTAAAGGGAIRNRGVLNITNTTITGSTSGGAGNSSGGGGINNTGQLTLTGSTVSNNTAGENTNGGGLDNEGQMTLLNTVVTGNSATANGGGINMGGTQASDFLRITDSTISNNRANTGVNTTGVGGGISVEGNPGVTLTRSTISGNSALNSHPTSENQGHGGGIYSDGQVLMDSCTVSGNSAAQNFGGVRIPFSSSDSTVTNSTIVNNTAGLIGGGIGRNSCSLSCRQLSIGNTIVANNTAPTDPDIRNAQANSHSTPITSSGYNLIEVAAGAFISLTTTDITGVDPNLGPLQDNGGPTQTHAPLAGSPAIDKGNPTTFPATDQRGVARPQDGDASGAAQPDIGAVEVQLTPPAGLSVSGKVTDANGSPLAGVAVTLSGPHTLVALTDAAGNYSFTNLLAGGDYAVAAASPYYAFGPRRVFPNFIAAQVANFQAAAGAATGVPVPSDSFDAPERDAAKWSLGLLTQPPAAFDPLVPVSQQTGRLVISPRANVTGPHYNGYVTVRAFDFVGGRLSVEVVEAARNGAETSFAVGTGPDDYFRFVVRGAGGAAASGGGARPLADATQLVLVFEVKIGGVLNPAPPASIPYDPVQHRFWRFRHDAPANAIAFETSADNVAYAERFRRVLEKSVSAMACEMSAGTAQPIGDPGQARFDNLSLVTATTSFSAADYSVGEGEGRATITVTRAGNVAGAATLSYQTEDADTFTVGCADAAGAAGAAFARCDFATTVGTLQFAANEISKSFTVPVIDDGHVEGPQTFSLKLVNASGASLGAPALIRVTIQDNDAAGAPNPVVSSFPFFVRQQYLDFLSREPDQGGFNAWLGVLNNCPNAFAGPEVQSTCDRIYVSGEGFFRSPEFALKGAYAFRLYKAAFDRLPEYTEIVSDMSFIAGQTAEEVFARRAEVPVRFTARPEFQALYGGVSNQQYVAALLGRYQLQQVTAPDPQQPDGAAKVVLTAAELTSRLDSGALTRAQVLRAVADSDEVTAAEFDNAFVAMQYYGYLRRKPEPSGYEAWLRVLQSGDVRTMVNGFLNSAEYKLRFGQP